MKQSLATIYLLTGEYDKSMNLLEYLLKTPSSLQVEMLKLYPAWDPLRGNSRFQALIAEGEEVP